MLHDSSVPEIYLIVVALCECECPDGRAGFGDAARSRSSSGESADCLGGGGYCAGRPAGYSATLRTTPGLLPMQLDVRSEFPAIALHPPRPRMRRWWRPAGAASSRDSRCQFHAHRLFPRLNEFNTLFWADRLFQRTWVDANILEAINPIDCFVESALQRMGLCICAQVSGVCHWKRSCGRTSPRAE